jgi:hypothetical protein
VVGSKRVALFALSLLFTSCVSVVWEREHWHRPPRADSVSALQEGDDLASCLEVLGAPLEVWQVTEGYALTWAWYDAQELSYKLQLPLSQSGSTSIKYTNIGRETEGLLLVFDAEDKLVLFEEGFLRDLMGEESGRSPALPPSPKGEA